MSNYHPVSYQNASPELRALYDEIVVTLKMSEPPNWLLYLGGAPHLVKGMWCMLKSVLVEGNLPPLLQELILFTVAYHRSAPYCLDLHASNVLRMTDTLDYQDLRQIACNESQGIIPDSYHAALKVAIKLATSTCRLEKTDFDNLLAAGFDQIQCMEVNTLVSAALYFNTYTFASDLPIEESIKGASGRVSGE